MKNLLSAFIWSTLLFSCDIGDNKVDLLDPFVRIYDREAFNSSYIPIDVKQTADGGYLILGETPNPDSNLRAIYIMRIDNEGNFVSDQVYDTQYAQPVGELLLIGGNYYFLCMHSISLDVHIVTVAPDGSTSAPVPVRDAEGNSLYFPLSAALDKDNNSILLQSFDNEEKETVFSKINTTGSATQTRRFSIGAGPDVEEPIIDHFTRSGKQFPFISGFMTDGRYYFNGFYNFTFSLVFLDLGTEDEPGVLQGVGSESGISAALHLNGNTFAGSRFSYGQNYILPQVEINVSSETPGSSEDLTGNSFPELRTDARVILKRIQVGGQNFLIYASDTKSKQILLLAYNESTGELMNTKRLGFSIPYEVAGFTATADGGLAVVGTAYVAGRFPRVCLFKLSAQEVLELVGQ